MTGRITEQRTERVTGQVGGPGYAVRLPIAGHRVLVVGGGTAALRRVSGLVEAGATVTVVAPELTPSLLDLGARSVITVVRRPYAAGDISGAWLVFACTGVAEIDATVAADADSAWVWCLRDGDPAPLSAEPTSATGASAAVTESVPGPSSPVSDTGEDAPALERHDSVAATPGRVVLVGGGPGDSGLLTVRGREWLHAADVVVVDRLAPLAVLDELPAHVRIVDAAKVPRGPAADQNRINDLLVAHARAGRTVVRLKGGDPYVLGRGKEESRACAEAGVPVEVVPGVSSALAAPAVAGIPLTHRGLSQGFTVLSGHVPPGDPRSSVDWAAAARSGTTLVVLMAVENLAAITAALISAGIAPETPSACIVEGGLPRQTVVTAPVIDLVEAADNAGVRNPAVVVVGEVAGAAEAAGAAWGGGDEPPARRRPHTVDTQQPRAVEPATRVLVLGGARSGKSATAERMLASANEVVYVATGAAADGTDPEWDERVRRHQQQRPAHWSTVETCDLSGLLAVDGPPLVVDCLSTWLAATMDAYNVWSESPDANAALAARITELAEAWAGSARTVVAVSSEVGSGVVPASAAGRRFRDELGALNARIAAAADETWQCIAGVPRRLR